MGSMPSMLCWGLIFPHLQYMGFTHSMLCWGLYTEYSVGSPYLHAISESIACWGLIFSIVCGVPISTRVLHTACYVEGLD